MEMLDVSGEEDMVPTSLREYAKHRMMVDMIDTVRKLEKSNNSYLIMVMDKHTRELFAAIWNLFDIMTKNVFHLENLELKRKEFPHTPVIYFISPTKSSIDILKEDFKDPDNPHYASIHLFFSTKLPDKLMQSMSETQGLVERMKSLNELNVDLNLYEDNIYHLDQNDSLSLFCSNLKDPTIDSFLYQIGLQISTVWAVMNEKPYIQYQGNSRLAKRVSESVNKQIKNFEENSPDNQFRDPRATLLILDRSFDMTAPFLHDYAYEWLIYEIIEHADQAEDLWTEEAKQEHEGQSEKVLDRNDVVWHRYKTKHFANSMVAINNEISRFVQENKNISAMKKGDELQITDLKDVLAGMPKYQELLSVYSKHLTLWQKVDSDIKERKIVDLIRIEQMIISGIDDSGKEVTNKQILKSIEGIYRELDLSDHIRLIMIYIAWYEIPEKDLNTLLSTLNHKYHDAWINMKYFGADWDSGPIRRRVEVMSENDYRDYNDRLASTNYEILKSTPTIAKLAMLWNEGTLDQGNFPFLGEVPETANRFGHSKVNGFSKMKGKLRRRWQNKKDTDAPDKKLLIFVIGGLSHHEIVSLNKMQEENEIDCMIIQGGNQVFTGKQFIKQMQNLKNTQVKVSEGVDEESLLDPGQIGIDFT